MEDCTSGFGIREQVPAGNAHGMQLLLKDAFAHILLVRQAWKCVERILAVFKSNPLLSEELLKVQRPDPGCIAKNLVRPGDTRWNSRLAAMKRIAELHASINFVLAGQKSQTASYKILEQVNFCDVYMSR